MPPIPLTYATSAAFLILSLILLDLLRFLFRTASNCVTMRSFDKFIHFKASPSPYLFDPLREEKEDLF